MIQFKAAERQNIALLIGLAGGTGSGKTMSAMRIAQGIVGRGNKFAVIDTENGRALHYAPRHGEQPDYKQTFLFDHLDLRAPFRPEAYADAIEAADKAGYGAVVVDSMTHVWAGDGGVLDWQDEELDRMAGDDWKKRESCKMAAWIKPKTSHKQMVSRLLQVKAHVILCFRAEEKIEMVKEDGKMKIVPKTSLTGADGWIPVCEKNLPFELTCSFLMLAAQPGIPKPIKLQEQHRGLIPLNRPMDESVGSTLAAWARGEIKESIKKPELPEEPMHSNSEFINVDQQTALDDALHDAKIRTQNLKIKDEFLAACGITKLSELPAGKYQNAIKKIQEKGRDAT